MRNLLTGLVMALISVTALAQTDLIHNMNGRITTSLNGHWQIIIDPLETGYYNYRYQPDPNGFFNNRVPEAKEDRIEYSFDDTDRLMVPGDWNSQRSDLEFYEGTIWYKKSFEYDLKPNTRVYVHFGAVNYEAIVWINGEKLGEHKGGFTPFNFEITDHLQGGENFIIVKADNQRALEAVPTLNFDWWNYGGITRPVNLIEVPDTYIQDYFIQLAPGSADQVQGYVRLDGENTRQKVRISVPELNVDETVRTDRDGYAEVSFGLQNLERWSPDNPKLYDVILESESDRITDRIGFRTLETEGTRVLLNGEPLFLRGVCIHEEAPYRSARAYSEEDAEALLGWAKEMHCNFARLAHYPHNENMTRTADEMGILIWSEVPVYWTIQWDNIETYENAENQLEEMIHRDKNKASVALWSVANETPLSEERLVFLRKLVERTKELDETRFTTAAMERHYLDDGVTLMIDDPLGEYVDVLGVNEYIGWYDGLPAKAETVRWETVYSKPVIFSEFGGGALYNYHGDALTRWTEEFQASIYEYQTDMFQRVPFLAGTTPWLLMDFKSPRRPLSVIQDFYNRKGLVSPDGFKKQAFYTMQKFYQQIEEQGGVLRK
ncbi:MAG: beta-glucuronidase [Candidatus Marinimicrobia bacterium]|nr:beta-glucuronidase [Candidatus Neomarinimicrobiota bacterium]